MKSRAIAVLVLGILMAAGCIKEGMTGADLKVGESLPDFEVMMDDGTVMNDEILDDGISVVMFFHTSCPDCQQVLPVMQDIYDEYASKSVRFCLISREDPSDNIRVYWEEKGFNMPYSAQNDRSVYQKFAKERIPRVYINEKGGIIRYIFTDNPNPVYSDISSALESLIR